MAVDSQTPAGLAPGLAHGKGTSAFTTKITFVADRFKDHGVGWLFVCFLVPIAGTALGVDVLFVLCLVLSCSARGFGAFESVRSILISM